METALQNTANNDSGSQGSPFDFLSDLDSAFDAAPLGGEPAPYQEASQPNQDGVPSQERQISPEEQRIRDWQAKYDSLQSEFDRYRTSSEDANPIWRAVQGDPQVARQVLEVVGQSLSGNGSRGYVSGVGHQPAESIAPQEPTPPGKPADYSDHDSVMEPNSASWVYRQQYEQYKDNLMQHKLDAQAHRFESMLAPVTQTLVNQQEQAKANQLNHEIRGTFAESGLSSEQTDDVMGWASQYAITVDDIVTLHRMRTGQAPQQQQQRQPMSAQVAQDSLARQNRLNYPLPAAVAGGANVAPARAEDQIMTELLAMERENNAF